MHRGTLRGPRIGSERPRRIWPAVRERSSYRLEISSRKDAYCHHLSAPATARLGEAKSACQSPRRTCRCRREAILWQSSTIGYLASRGGISNLPTRKKLHANARYDTRVSRLCSVKSIGRLDRYLPQISSSAHPRSLQEYLKGAVKRKGE